MRDIKKELCDKVFLVIGKELWEELLLIWLIVFFKLIFIVGFFLIWFFDGYSVIFWEFIFLNLGWFLLYGLIKCLILVSVNFLYENKNKISLIVIVVFWLVNKV